ncbi:MAG TPA: SH3 domain-containing protein [Aggregatilineales bacterium]|nr:SH3 domain-containing protein [Anaerolineae bacterium]HUN09078.1 SH3 domain-containing protein [Aggregatilineales bacterium]
MVGSRAVFLGLLTLLLLSSIILAHAQEELAASLEVLAPGVEVQRVNTEGWIAVTVEAIVGVGDTIRTDATGRARITFFADGVDTELLPGTTYRIQKFQGNDTSFVIEAEVLAGQTTQRLTRLLDPNSSYNINTPAMQLVARGTAFAIRVEPSGRSAMLVSEGSVGAGNPESDAQVDPGFGIRADESLSDVVEATTFDGLDAALDGCSAALSTPDDVSLNVRLGAGQDFPRIGTVSATDITNLVGTTESGDWYRIDFRGGFGWILSTTAEIGSGCAGLRLFPDGYGPEDASLYSSLGDPVTLEDLPDAEATPEATPAP